MPQRPDWKHVLATDLQFVQFRRAYQLGAGLIRRIQQARDQLSARIDELVEIGRHRNEELGRIVRSGTDRQFAGLGLVTKTDLVAFERRMRLAPTAKTAQATKKVTARRDGAKKPASASTAKRTS